MATKILKPVRAVGAPTLDQLGKTLQTTRESRRLTLTALASRSKVSIGMLSQIERGQANPSFVTMSKIAGALGIPMSSFLDGSKPNRNHVVRVKDRRRLVFPEIGLTYQLLTPDLNRDLELLLIEVAPGLSTRNRVFSHEGEESGMLLQGTLEVHVDGEIEVLNEGDSISFLSKLPHWYRNPGKKKAIAVWAITPPSF